MSRTRSTPVCGPILESSDSCNGEPQTGMSEEDIRNAKSHLTSTLHCLDGLCFTVDEDALTPEQTLAFEVIKTYRWKLSTTMRALDILQNGSEA